MVHTIQSIPKSLKAVLAKLVLILQARDHWRNTQSTEDPKVLGPFTPALWATTLIPRNHPPPANSIEVLLCIILLKSFMHPLFQHHHQSAHFSLTMLFPKPPFTLLYPRNYY